MSAAADASCGTPVCLLHVDQHVAAAHQRAACRKTSCKAVLQRRRRRVLCSCSCRAAVLCNMTDALGVGKGVHHDVAMFMQSTTHACESFQYVKGRSASLTQAGIAHSWATSVQMSSVSAGFLPHVATSTASTCCSLADLRLLTGGFRSSSLSKRF